MQAGDVGTARRTFERLRPMLRLLFSAANPSVIKAKLSIEGRISDEVRMPLMPASSRLVEQLAESRGVLAELHAEFALAVQ